MSFLSADTMKKAMSASKGLTLTLGRHQSPETRCCVPEREHVTYAYSIIPLKKIQNGINAIHKIIHLLIKGFFASFFHSV